MRNNYWQSGYSLSFPRLRPCAVGITPAYMPEVEMSLSTRDAVPIVVNSVSAGSKTQPGGYAGALQELEQFSSDDNRSPQDVAQALILAGLQPVFPDWDY